MHSNAASGKRTERRRPGRAAQAHRASAKMVMTDYSPKLYAFRFPNAFVNQLWSGRLPPFIGRKYEFSTSGRCGGMAFASLDFFHVRTPVPALASKDFSPSNVPPDGHPLADYIFTRQLHSMLTTLRGLRDGLRYIRWSGYSATTIFAKTTAEEHKIVKALDRGQPVVLGLIKATSRRLTAQGVNHQVVCYGYRTDAVGRLEFYVYDPNEPLQASSSEDDAAILGQGDDAEHAEFPFQVKSSRRMDRWRGFFVVDYRPRQPSAHLLSAQQVEEV